MPKDKKFSIPEDRSVKKSEAAVLKELESRSFAEEIERDKNKSGVMLQRGEKAKEALSSSKSAKVLGLSEKDLNQEVAAADVYKRALILIGASGMTVTSNEGAVRDASDNNLPVSSYLSHGARCLVQIPAGSNNDELINWLTSGDKEKNGRSESQDHNVAMQEGKYVYNRSAATHDVSIKDGKVKETKGFLIGARDFFANKILGRKTNHYGVDLACDAEFGGNDSTGKPLLKPDGNHGHLYIHYKPATETEPGSIMIGMEGAAPRSSKHSKVGASDPISPTGCSKFDDLAKKKKCAAEAEYEETIVPKKYNGLRANLTAENMKAIVNVNTSDFGTELAEAKAGKSLETFKSKIDKGEFHKSPEKLEEPKKMAEVKKPGLWKNFANKITFGVAYKQEQNAYKKYKKEQKISEKISHGKSERTNYNNMQPQVEKPVSRVERRTSVGAPDKTPISERKQQKKSELGLGRG